MQQALENAQREEKECQQDLINGREKMEVERSEKERSGAREEGVNASQHAPGQGPKRHIHTEFSSEVDEVVLVEGNSTEHGVEDQEGASQESVDLARLLNRDSDGDSVGDSGSEEEMDIPMTDARPATRMEVNRRELHYMDIFEEIVQHAIGDADSQAVWEAVLTPTWAAVELGRILGAEYLAQVGPGLPVAKAQMTEHYRQMAKDFLQSERGLAAWQEACEQGVLASQQAVEEMVLATLF